MLCFQRYKATPEDLQHVGELGTGSCGHVVKMVHKPSGKVLAVKVSVDVMVELSLSGSCES